MRLVVTLVCCGQWSDQVALVALLVKLICVQDVPVAGMAPLVASEMDDLKISKQLSLIHI